MSDSSVTAVVTVHDENPLWIKRAIWSILCQKKGVSKILVIADNASDEVSGFLNIESVAHWSWNPSIELVSVNYGDLGSSRNHAVSLCNTEYVAFLDGDDLWGSEWIRQALDVADKQKKDCEFAVHNQLSLFFGQVFAHGQSPYFQMHIGSDSDEFDPRQMIQFNPWSALAFAKTSTMKAHPYFRADDVYGYEDYEWAVRTLGAGVSHFVAEGSLHAVRLKADASSLAHRNVKNGLVIPKCSLFDVRAFENKASNNSVRFTVTDDQAKQILDLHHVIGEYQVMVKPDSAVRKYPQARSFNTHARLRDDIGDAKHVVLIQNLIRGGAEKYAIDWAAAIGPTCVVISTGFGDQTDESMAKNRGVRFIEWENKENLSEQEMAIALQRALIQSDLDSVFICNSSIGLALGFENPGCLAKKIFIASFATIPSSAVGDGYLYTCPPFWFKKNNNVVIVSDNEEHAQKIRDFNEMNVKVVETKCSYDGPSKLSRIDKKRHRVLWASRGSPDKRPDLLPSIAKEIESFADIHVWGDVTPMNGPESLKYRGPFDGFASIDGSYDCYLMTSMNEGMPNTALEAIMADLPVVAPAVGGLGYISNYVFVDHDVKEIASKIKECVSRTKEFLYESNKLSHKKCVENWRDGFDYRVREIVNEGKDDSKKL